MKLFRYLLILFLSILLFTCKDGSIKHTTESENDSTSVELIISQKLNITDRALLNQVDEYIKKIENSRASKNDYVFQLIIGRFIKGYSNVILSVETDKINFSKKNPIGYFNYKGRVFLVYSAIGDYCAKDTNLLIKSGINQDWVNASLGHGSSIPKQPEWEPPSIILKKINNTIEKKGVIHPFFSRGFKNGLLYFSPGDKNHLKKLKNANDDNPQFE